MVTGFCIGTCTSGDGRIPSHSSLHSSLAHIPRAKIAGIGFSPTLSLVVIFLLIVQGSTLVSTEESSPNMPLIVSEYDTRTYRIIKLENELEALLIHDADADKVRLLKV